MQQQQQEQQQQSFTEAGVGLRTGHIRQLLRCEAAVERLLLQQRAAAFVQVLAQQATHTRLP